MQANVVETSTGGDSCKALQLFAHAAAAGQRSAGVRPYGGDDPAVVPPRQHDDVRGAEESSVSGLGVDGVGGDGTRTAEAHLVRGDDCVEVEQAVQSGECGCAREVPVCGQPLGKVGGRSRYRES